MNSSPECTNPTPGQGLVTSSLMQPDFETLKAKLNTTMNDIRCIVVVTMLDASRPYMPDYTSVKERLNEELYEACVCLYETKGDLPSDVSAHFLHLFSWQRLFVKEGFRFRWTNLLERLYNEGPADDSELCNEYIEYYEEQYKSNRYAAQIAALKAENSEQKKRLDRVMDALQ